MRNAENAGVENVEAEDVGEHCKGGKCRIENAGGDSSQYGKPAPCGAGTAPFPHFSILVHSLPHFLPFFPFPFYLFLFALSFYRTTQLC